MSAVIQVVDPRVILDSAHTAVDALLAADLTPATDDQVLDVLREVERLRRRLAVIDHAAIAEVEARSLPAKHAVRTTGGFLRMLLHVDPAEAAARVRAAHAAGPRRAVTGEPLPALYPAVADAQAAGRISERHAAVIISTIEKLPDPPRHEQGAAVEMRLVEHAQHFDPRELGKLALRISAYLDPDGRYRDLDYRERTRDLTLHSRPDGSARLTAELTAQATALLQVHLDALAAPKPEHDGVKDPRTAGQRRHDALCDALKLVIRAGRLPSVGGVTATVVITMTEEAYRTGAGLAQTSHGALVPAREALRWAAGDLRVLAVVLDKIKGITGYSSAHRLFTENQRLAMGARDGGCTFPNCPTPPGICEIHHLIEFARGGPTTVENGALVCPHDHHHRVAQGWSARLVEGRIAWIPPRWIDRDQKPQYNELHRPLLSEEF
jgi:hypothetical protein